jgi:hypothetical protein
MGHGTICCAGTKTKETDATSMELPINSSIVSTIKSSLCFASAIALTLHFTTVNGYPICIEDPKLVSYLRALSLDRDNAHNLSPLGCQAEASRHLVHIHWPSCRLAETTAILARMQYAVGQRTSSDSQQG